MTRRLEITLRYANNITASTTTAAAGPPNALMTPIHKVKYRPSFDEMHNKNSAASNILSDTQSVTQKFVTQTAF